MAIESFTGPYRFLSNFFIEPDGTCVEVEYQRAKCVCPEDRVKFDGLSPGDAKRLGKRIRLRADWDFVKNAVMLKYVSRKFCDHHELMQRLLETDEQELIEGNNWGDSYWGVCAGTGTNMLGKILMAVRDHQKRKLLTRP